MPPFFHLCLSGTMRIVPQAVHNARVTRPCRRLCSLDICSRQLVPSLPSFRGIFAGGDF